MVRYRNGRLVNQAMKTNFDLEYRVFISAGEASGDLHASNLVKETQQLLSATTAGMAPVSPSAIKFYGMGGALMRAAGVETVVDATSELAVIGGIEVLFHVWKIWQVMRTVKRALIQIRPQLLILVDYPGFNLWLAKVAKKLGIKVLYYISPKIWAWNQGRVKKIIRDVDMMAVIFPFEVAFYNKFNVPVTLVRHPSLDSVKPTLDKNAAQRVFNLDATALTVGLFPGSRNNEIKYILPAILESAALLQRKYSKMQFVLPLAHSLSEELVRQYLRQYQQLQIHLIKNQVYDAASVCDAIIATSGTVTLEITLLGVPMVIVYKLSNLTYCIVKQIIKVPYIGLCNIIAGKKIVQELIQRQASAQNISAEIARILEDKDYCATMIMELRHIRAMLAGSVDGDSATTAGKSIGEVVIGMLHS